MRSIVAAVAIILGLAWWAGSASSLAAAPSPARPGAAPPAIATLAVDIWPEHDDPRVLVIYRGTLAADATLPQTLTFAIPPSGQVNAAAYRTDDGQLLSTPHEYRQEADRLLVTFTIPARGFQFEYYVDGITGLPQRTFALDLAFPFAVENLKVSVEQPLRSSAFILTPPAGGTTAAAGGFTHHVYDLGRLPVGKVWRVRATYRKEDANPSVARAVQIPEPGASAQAAPGRPLWRWIVGGAVVVLGLGGVALIGYRRRRWPFASGRATPTRQHPARQHPARRETPRRDSPDRIYCSRCGARARPRDRFCSRCGQPLARE